MVDVFTGVYDNNMMAEYVCRPCSRFLKSSLWLQVRTKPELLVN